MVSVNPRPDPSDEHAVALMGWLMKQVSRTIAAEDWGGLRPSHFRMLSAVPAQGVRISELAERLAMSKQGCGQFVTQLVGTGHLTVEVPPGDRRSRFVRRTPVGDRAVADFTERVGRLEDGWAQQVGARRYAAFRAVLEELAAP